MQNQFFKSCITNISGNIIDICIYSDNIDCTNPVTSILHKDYFTLNTLYHAFLIIYVVGFSFFHQKSNWADAVDVVTVGVDVDDVAADVADTALNELILS